SATPFLGSGAGLGAGAGWGRGFAWTAAAGALAWPGTAKKGAHLGHLIFFPGARGAAVFKGELHLGQWNTEPAIRRRLIGWDSAVRWRPQKPHSIACEKWAASKFHKSEAGTRVGCAGSAAHRSPP